MLNKYETFLEVIRTQSMSKAAQNTHQTTPGVSYAISTLEDTLGVVLLTRNHSKIVPTPMAEELLPLIQDVVDAHRRVLDRVEAIRAIDTGVVRIGGLRAASMRWIPEILRRMQIEAPGISVQPIMNRYEESINDLTEGRVDIALLEDPGMKSFEFLKITDDPYMVVVPKNHRFSEMEGVHISDFTGENLIIPQWPITGNFGEPDGMERMQPFVSYRIQDERTIIAMVQNRLGIAVMPKLMIPDHCEDVALIPLYDFKPKRLGMVFANAKYCTHAVKKFISVAMDYFHEIGMG